MIKMFLVFFILKIIIECGIVKLLIHKEKILKDTLLINITINAMLFICGNMLLLMFGYFESLILFVFELIAIIVEGYFYSLMDGVTRKRAYLTSIIANIVSCGLAVMFIFYIIENWRGFFW